jgi:hypothetical protein
MGFEINPKPSGGTGLLLQAVTPGIVQPGNTNIDGTMLAGGFSTSGGVNNVAEVFGRGNVGPFGPSSTIVGNSNTNNGNGSGGNIMFGVNNISTAQQAVAMGVGCQAGASAPTGTGPQVALGSGCVAGEPTGQGVAVGINCSANGAVNQAFGNNVQIVNASGAFNPCVGVGFNITCGAAAKLNMLFGTGIAPVSRNNVLVMGAYGVAVGQAAYPAAGAGQVDNSILIGNPNQTVVQIGPYVIAGAIQAPCLVAALPAGVAGMRGFVTNALGPAFGVAVAGGGAVGVPVYHDGTSWKVG